jgi:hypothetical protein
MKSGNVKLLEPSGTLQACNGTAVTLYRVHRIFWFIMAKLANNKFIRHFTFLDQ